MSAPKMAPPKDSRYAEIPPMKPTESIPAFLSKPPKI